MSTSLIIVGAIVLLLCAGWVYQKVGERRDARRFAPPGRMVDMGSRRLHVVHKGMLGGPTVVIEQGAGGPSTLWWAIVDRVAQFASVCAYDRAGIGSSDRPPAALTPQDSARELHAMLERANIPGPYVLVAHSYGGLIARLFARDYRRDVAGLVLVDTVEEGVHFRPDVLKLYSRFGPLLSLLAVAARVGAQRVVAKLRPDNDPKVPADVRDRLAAAAHCPSFYLGMKSDLRVLSEWDPAMRQPGATGTLDDTPLIVVTHGQPFPGAFSVLEKYWPAGQERLRSLSTNSALIVARNSSHMIQFDEPEVVVDAIRRVCEAAVSGGRVGAVARDPAAAAEV